MSNMKLWVCLALVACAILCGEAAPSDVCNLPLEEGKGDEALEKFYFDSTEGKCKKFTYKGRGGNKNRFRNKKSCEKECPIVDETSCDVKPSTIANGQVKQTVDERGRDALEFTCNPGFQLEGYSLVSCCNGRWDADLPKCVESLAVDCKAHFDAGKTTDGAYKISPDGTTELMVYCDMTTEGGGWTVIQRRVDDTTDFYRDWAAYKQGFGDYDGNFWIGLDNIYELTKADSEVYAYMQAEEGDVRHARFSHFQVSGEESKYTLAISGYSGDAGDSMSYHNGAKFTTKDADNDVWGQNCAVKFTGAFWYKSCHLANFNGKYLNGPHTEFATGINWKTFKGYHYSLKYFEFKVRRN